jgi:hypothetical protein
MRIKFLALLIVGFFLVAFPAYAQSETVTLTWTAGANDVSYDVYRAPGACSTTSVFALLNATPVTTLTYTDSSAVLVAGSAAVTYCYQVTALSSSGAVSAPSNQAPAVIPISILPAPPVLATPVVTPVATPAPAVKAAVK